MLIISKKLIIMLSTTQQTTKTAILGFLKNQDFAIISYNVNALPTDNFTAQQLVINTADRVLTPSILLFLGQRNCCILSTDLGFFITVIL